MPDQAPPIEAALPTAETLLLVDDEAQSLRILSETLAGEGLRFSAPFVAVLRRTSVEVRKRGQYRMALAEKGSVPNSASGYQ